MPMAQNIERKHKVHEPSRQAYPVKAGEKLFLGALACAPSVGGTVAVPGLDAAGYRFLGMVTEGYDNTDGADGVLHPRAERYIVVDRAGKWQIPFTGTPELGKKAYILDDGQCTTAPVSNVECGVVVELGDAAGHWVDIGAAR